jgi:hypothetical protein
MILADGPCSSWRPGGQVEAGRELSSQMSNNRHRLRWMRVDIDLRPPSGQAPAALVAHEMTWLRDEEAVDSIRPPGQLSRAQQPGFVINSG